MKPTYSTTIRKRGDTFGWQIRIKKDDQWQYHSSQHGYLKEREAKQAMQKAVEELKLQPEEAEYTFGQIADLYIERGSKAPGTIRAYKSWVKNLHSIKDLKITEVKKVHAERAIYDYYANHLYGGTDDLLRFARSVCKYAIEHLEVNMRNPFTGLKLVERPDKGPKDINVLQLDQIHALISKLEEQGQYEIAFLTALMGLCGLRVGEARGLTKEHLKADLDVRKQRYEGGTVTTRLKTKNSRRTVPVPDAVRRLAKTLPVPLTPDTLYVDACYASRDLKTAYKYAGYDVKPHALRHSYATNLIERGVDFKTVAALLGDTVEMVMKTYSHVNNNMMDNAVKIARAF